MAQGKDKNSFGQPPLFELTPDTQQNIPHLSSESEATKEEKNVSSGNDRTDYQIFLSLLELSSIERIGFHTICHMYDTGFLLDLWDPNTDIENHSFWQRKDYATSKNFILKNLDFEFKYGKERAEFFRSVGISFISKINPEYPKSLSRLKDAPRWLFIEGNRSLFSTEEQKVAIVGTRDASNDGKKLAYEISKTLAKEDLIIVSGLAQGIDEYAHRGCVEYYGRTVAVLGYGLGYYRIGNELLNLRKSIIARGGAVITEYLFDDPPSRSSFLKRNGILANLSNLIVPIEFPSSQSGTGATILHGKHLEIPIIGFSIKEFTDISMIETKKNLIGEGIEVFDLDQISSDRIKEIVQNLLPNHHWGTGYVGRQDRFFSQLVEYIVRNAFRIDLTEDSIDYFSQLLKENLKGQPL